MTARRRRGFLLFSVALASGGLAASRVQEHERAISDRIGPDVEVLVAARDLRAGARVTRGVLALRHVPARFVPPDALASPAGVVGARTSAAVAAGGYVTAGLLERRNAAGRKVGVGRGWRAVTVEVAGGTALGELTPSAQVDVLVSTESGAVGGRTVVALAGAELLRIVPGSSTVTPEPEIEAERPTSLATLRVTPRQAVYLTAADNFAREIRLLPRPPGDRSPAGVAIAQGEL